MVVLADFNTPYQNLDPFIEAMALAKDVKLLIIGSGKYLDKYLVLAEKLGVTDRIRSVGHVPYDQLSKYLCKASIGIVGRPHILNPEYLYTIPTKVYDYLAAGLPVLAYGPPNSELQRFVENNRVGVYLTDLTSKAIFEALSKLFDEVEGLRERVLTVAKQYDRKMLGYKLVEFVKKLL